MFRNSCSSYNFQQQGDVLKLAYRDKFSLFDKWKVKEVVRTLKKYIKQNYDVCVLDKVFSFHVPTMFEHEKDKVDKIVENDVLASHGEDITDLKKEAIDGIEDFVASPQEKQTNEDLSCISIEGQAQGSHDEEVPYVHESHHVSLKEQ